ncbi:unnamed protein product [Ceratitis capitata]|uniref:(Mediterranean fruit fly) hypothetical protein n=1 Tax=Ceratitis capitata TaxID=7213 RepID=A0A811UCB3_CERCA|nr:unnamed protein product [Ceratitis capitata]
MRKSTCKTYSLMLKPALIARISSYPSFCMENDLESFETSILRKIYVPKRKRRKTRRLDGHVRPLDVSFAWLKMPHTAFDHTTDVIASSVPISTF